MLKKYEPFLYSAAGLAALFAILVAFNYLASSGAARVDFTAGNLYTLSEGTKKILKKLDGPVKVRLYISQNDNNAIPVQLRSFAQRVEDITREVDVALLRGEFAPGQRQHGLDVVPDDRRFG